MVNLLGNSVWYRHSHHSHFLRRGVHAKPVTEGNLRHLKGTVKGPEGTVYDGGVFEIDIQLPNAYPFEPPKMKFITKIWHPNISSQTGAICLVRQSIIR